MSSKCNHKLIVSSNDKVKNAIKIGPVLDKDTRKKSDTNLLDVYKNFYQVFNAASKERLVQSEAKRIVNVHVVTGSKI